MRRLKRYCDERRQVATEWGCVDGVRDACNVPRTDVYIPRGRSQLSLRSLHAFVSSVCSLSSNFLFSLHCFLCAGQSSLWHSTQQ